MKKTIVFDLDGTLVDSVRDLVPALNKTTALDGLPPIAREDVGHVVGQGAFKMIERAFAFHNQTVELERHKELLNIFLKFYEENTANETIYFEGVIEALDLLEADGWQFVICTNKYEHLARKLIAGLGHGERFAALSGSDTFEMKKPDPLHIIKTIEMANGDPKRSIMIGDSISDIAGAKAAPMPSIGVTFGYTDVPVEELGPDIVISHFDQLAAAVANVSATNGWA